MRTLGLGQLLGEVFAMCGPASATPETARLPPPDQMPMFIRGLHSGLLGLRDSTEFRQPDFSASKELAVFTDFSDRSGPWRSYAFVFCSMEVAEETCGKLAALREELAVADGRRFEYKALRDRKRWQVIQSWLSAFDLMPGVAFAMLVHRDVVSAFKVNSTHETDELLTIAEELGLGDWAGTASGGRILEEAFRIVHCVAYWHAMLTRGQAPLHWYCDNDEILAGPIRRASIERLLPMVVEKYCGSSVTSRLSTEAEIGPSPLRDLLSIPDLLAAGVLEHQRGMDFDAKDAIAKAAVIGDWLRETHALQKLALRITPMEKGEIWWETYRPYFAPRAESPPGS